MSTASKIFSKLNHIAGVGNGGFLITKNPATPTAAFEITVIAVVENGGNLTISKPGVSNGGNWLRIKLIGLFFAFSPLCDLLPVICGVIDP